MSEDAIAANLHQVRARIQAAAERAGRAPESVALIAVSKKQPAEAIRAARAAGQRAFGESYLQEALDKIARLADLDIEWHFIGRIQANKTRQIAAHFDWVHGLADADHARRLSEQRPPDRPPLAVCLQINLSGETSKAGVAPAEAAALLELLRLAAGSAGTRTHDPAGAGRRGGGATTALPGIARAAGSTRDPGTAARLSLHGHVGRSGSRDPGRRDPRPYRHGGLRRAPL